MSFRCEPGTVTGFLGPNGAGKSTTHAHDRRADAARPPARASVLGAPYRDLPNPGREVGVLLDASAQHAGRTGREVLTLAAITMGAPSAEVAEKLD